jgi:hypothetical protein
VICGKVIIPAFLKKEQPFSERIRARLAIDKYSFAQHTVQVFDFIPNVCENKNAAIHSPLSRAELVSRSLGRALTPTKEVFCMGNEETRHDETQVEVSEVTTAAGEAKPVPAPSRKLPKNLVSIISGIVVVILLVICLGLAWGGYYVYDRGLLAGIGIGTKPSVKVVQGYMQDSLKAVQTIRKAYEPLLQYLEPEDREREMQDFPTAMEMEEMEYKVIEESSTRAVISVKGRYAITRGTGDEAVTTRERVDETITVVKAEDGKWYLSEFPYWWPPGY